MNDKTALDVFKSKRFLTFAITAFVVFLNDLFQLSIGDDAVQVVVYLAGVVIAGYSIQDAAREWRGKVGKEIEDLFKEIIVTSMSAIKEVAEDADLEGSSG